MTGKGDASKKAASPFSPHSFSHGTNMDERHHKRWTRWANRGLLALEGIATFLYYFN